MLKKGGGYCIKRHCRCSKIRARRSLSSYESDFTGLGGGDSGWSASRVGGPLVHSIRNGEGERTVWLKEAGSRGGRVFSPSSP